MAGRDNSYSRADRREIVTSCVARYRTAMRRFAQMTNLDVWYAHAELDELQAQYQSMMNARQRKALVPRARPRP